jgi:hypothetical protein
VNSSMLAMSLGVAALFGPIFGSTGRGPPPKPFTGENAVLPGKAPGGAPALRGKWAFGYLQKDVTIEAGHQDALMFGLMLGFNDNGTYELNYHARWNLPAPSIVPIPIGRNAGEGLDGVNVTETGRFSLSGEILLLEPEETRYVELENDRMVKPPQTIANENRAYVVSLDKARLHVAGRCAKYQVEPICKESRDVWVQLGSQAGRRWLGAGPRG